MEGDKCGESEAEDERWPIDIVGELVVARGAAGPGSRRLRASPADDDADDEENGRCEGMSGLCTGSYLRPEGLGGIWMGLLVTERDGGVGSAFKSMLIERFEVVGDGLESIGRLGSLLGSCLPVDGKEVPRLVAQHRSAGRLFVGCRMFRALERQRREMGSGKGLSDRKNKSVKQLLLRVGLRVESSNHGSDSILEGSQYESAPMTESFGLDEDQQ
ncbi:hypothetical protein DL93DRAFT_2102787 [Clavulina sp. PMI_390]|nr:hypothetical protein DL93DRAFT_2102787 [Clavulina sp. PMI_390]